MKCRASDPYEQTGQCKADAVQFVMNSEVVWGYCKKHRIPRIGFLKEWVEISAEEAEIVQVHGA